MTFNTSINRALNSCVATLDYIGEKSGSLLAPCILGYMSGRIIGIGNLGLFQGTVSGIYHIMFDQPAANYVNNNKGKDANSLKPETVSFLEFVLAIAEYAVPILITYHFGYQTMDRLLSCLPNGTLKSMLSSVPTRQYSWAVGIFVNITPVLVQYWISGWHKEEKTQKKEG